MVVFHVHYALSVHIEFWREREGRERGGREEGGREKGEREEGREGGREVRCIPITLYFVELTTHQLHHN